MTAFKEVMVAEQEAEQAIATAHHEVQTSIEQARNDSRSRVESEKTILQAEAVKARHEKEVEVAGAVKKIASDTEAHATAIAQRFTQKRVELQAMVLQRFQ